MAYETIRVDIDGAVSTVTIDRPEQRNGMTGEMVSEMYEALQDLASRTDVRVVVLTATGDRFFCPGADLDLSRRDGGDGPPPLPDPRWMRSSVLLHEMPQVTLAAINGSCAGAGLGWAAACDLRVASSNAMFNTAFLDVGVAGDMGLPWSLGRLVGAARARELSFLRGKFDAAAAREMGLVSEVFAPAEFREGVAAIVERLRSAAPRALQAMKANYVASERMSFADFVDLETERHFQLVTGPEFAAGADAFVRARSGSDAGAAAAAAFAPSPADTEPYDEFALVAENAAEMGVDWPNDLVPRRDAVELTSGQLVSVIAWGTGSPELVFLHGGGQNAHTWDSVVVAAGRPALAIDLPGHGRSDRRQDRNYGPWENALAVAEVMQQHAPDAAAVVGMSLGGATLIRLAATRPELVRRAVIVDVTPQVNDGGRVMTPEQRGSVALVSGPPTYDSFAEVLAATMAASPNRTEAGVRRGVRHNTVRLEDGRWAWCYDLHGRGEGLQSWIDFTPLWDDVEAIAVPTMLVLGADSVYVLSEDVDEFRRRLPSVRVESVPGAGHAVQSDQPAALVQLLADFVPT